MCVARLRHRSLRCQNQENEKKSDKKDKSEEKSKSKDKAKDADRDVIDVEAASLPKFKVYRAADDSDDEDEYLCLLHKAHEIQAMDADLRYHFGCVSCVGGWLNHRWLAAIFGERHWRGDRGSLRA